MESKKYLTITFGCQMNEHDSEKIAGMLEEMGYSPVEEPSQADLIIVNTCCVRETAENKVYGLLGRLRRLKRTNPRLIIGVGGCMTQQQAVAARIKERFPHIDVIFGTHNLHRLPQLIRKAVDDRRRVLEVWPEARCAVENLPVKRSSRVRAWVTIMYGCNNFCTYCIVPHVRGREVSRRPENIIEEVRELGSLGYKEVTLLGQNVNSYGRDLEEEVDFADLLSALEEVEGIERIRYMTSHPRDFNQKLIRVISELKKVCEHVHLPVQAGSNAVLKRMGRGYTREHYMELVEAIRCAVPQVSITTDVMVGFPGESEEDFAATMDLIERVRFDSAFMFVYNRRPGTPAAGFDDQVTEEVKSRRIQELIELQNRITLEKNRAEVGRVLEVLVEGTDGETPNLYKGRTRTNKLVFFRSGTDLTGQLVPVKITEGTLTHLKGKLVEEEEG